VSALPYRLCAIDLDDTLLNPEHQISPRNAQAVRALVERGVIVLIASGRMYQATLRYAEQLDLATPIIAYNGAMVRNPRTEEVWLHEQIPADLATTVLDYCAEHHLQLNFYLNDLLYSAAYTPWLQLYHERTQSPIKLLPDFYTAVRGERPTKLIIVDSPEATDALLPYFRDVFGSGLYVTKSNNEYLEFMPPTANKGAALELTAARLGVTAEETIAFGDSWNDIPMLRWAGLGVAVGNAKPEVISAADRTIGRSEDDGVGIALEEIFQL
jgi:Cof subfamily protein (haloacid dehalogenase superfamily)